MSKLLTFFKTRYDLYSTNSVEPDAGTKSCFTKAKRRPMCKYLFSLIKLT